MRLHTLLLAAWAALVLAPCPTAGAAAPSAGPRQPRVAWSFVVRRSPDDTPHSKVFLNVNGRRVLVLPETEAGFTIMDRQRYHALGVPPRAIAACTGWWAGQGENLYVVRRSGRLIVFIQYLDEQEAIPPYKRLKSVRG